MRISIELVTVFAIVGTALAQLPPEIMVDRHRVRAERLLAGADFGGALAEMDAIIALQEKHDLKLPDEFDFKYAEVAFAAGRTEIAMDSLNNYLVAAGQSGEFYLQALELLDRVELAQGAAAEAATRRAGERRVFGGMEFAWVPAGEFLMGSTSSEAYADDQPVTRVRISRGYWLGKYEVTQDQWQAVTGTNPSSFLGCGNCPVEMVSWEDAQGFIGRLNARAGGARYRLPTEAEWEYAARAGTRGERYGNPDAIAWFDENSGGRTQPVGGKAPNAWGLHDMLGNVWEWVQDWYGDYPGGAVTDPRGPGSGSLRVSRGGSWNNSARNCRAPVRVNNSPGYRRGVLGLRLLRTE